MSESSPVRYHKRRGGRKRTVTSVKRSCDVQWSLLVRARARGRCERCHTAGRLEAHHAYGRTNHRLRFEPRNGVALCHPHHRWAEHFPLEFTDWFRDRRPHDAAFLAGENLKGTIRRTLNDYIALEGQLKAALVDVAEAVA